MVNFCVCGSKSAAAAEPSIAAPRQPEQGQPSIEEIFAAEVANPKDVDVSDVSKIVAKVVDPPQWNTAQGGAPPSLLQQLSRRSLNESTRAGPEKPHLLAAQPESPKVHRSLSVDSKLSCVYIDAPDARQSLALPPQSEAPVGSETLAAMDIAGIAAKLQSENWLAKFLQQAKQATDISATPWSASKRSAGVMVRKVTFTMSVPQDFPRAVTRLVNLPMETKVTAVFRMHQQPDQLLLTVQFCSHDVPYGENFHIHETIMLKPGSGDSVDAMRWVEVMWITALPWTHGILKTIIEQKSKADGLCGRVVNALKAESA